ncbi:MAG: protein kinase [Candidatus Xenobiia bacterium LiM19]
MKFRGKGSMVHQPLLSDFTLHDRYKIKKTLFFQKNHGQYTAFDTKVTEKVWLVKEFFHDPSGELSDEEKEKREKGFCETLEVVMNFDHPSLPRILDFFQEADRHYVIVEMVEGMTLQRLCESSVELLSETQILEWAIQIAEALSYLHSRPKPLIYSFLDPAHIMVTIGESESSNRIRLVNLGLNRFFDPQMPDYAFSTSLVDIAHDFYELGKTLFYLYTRKEFTPNAFFSSVPNASDAMGKIVARLLSDEPQRNYRDAKDLVRDLDRILHPPKKPAEDEESFFRKKKRPPLQILIPSKENLDRIIYAVLSQKLSHFVTEVVVLVVGLIVLWLFLHPGLNYTRSSPVVICACKDEMLTYNSQSQRLLERKTLDSMFSSMVPAENASRIYLSDYQKSVITIMETLHNQFTASIRVDRNPSRMVLSGGILYILNKPTNNISAVDPVKREMVGIFPTGNDPTDLVYLERSEKLYISNAGSDMLQILNPVKNKNEEDLKIPGGCSELALSPDQTRIYIANTKWDGITVFNPDAKSITEEIQNAGFKKISEMKFLKGEDELYMLDSEGFNLIVFDLKEKKAKSIIKVGKNPVDMAYDGKDRIWVVNKGSHNISVVNISIGYTEATISTGRSPSSILYIP